MTPPARLLATYAIERPQIEALQRIAVPILALIAENKEGLFFNRIKSADSIFEKMLLGKYSDPFREMDDLLATTIVLPNAPVGEQRAAFEELLRHHFTIEDIKTNRTEQPSQFVYDDLHYILRLKDTPLLRDKNLLKLRLELQVKSYLEHGWWKASHSLMFKSSRESWRASRVEAQTKAMVEMAEAALSVGDALLPKAAERSYLPIEERILISGAISEWWTRELPEDRRRLSRFTHDFMNIGGLSVSAFQVVLASARAAELVAKMSLTVQQAIIVLLVENCGSQLVEELSKRGDRFLLISPEMEAVSKPCKEIPRNIRINL